MNKAVLFIILTFIFFKISVLFAGTGEHNILEYGATPDGETMSTSAIQKAIDACAAEGGGKVVIPAGKYVTGPLFLHSNIHIEILAGAVLLAHQNIDEYPVIDGRWEGIERKIYASLFTGHDLNNITISGHGILDGQGKVWWDAHRINRKLRRQLGLEGREPDNPSNSPLKWPRPRMINLYRCKNVLIRDITLLNSPSWTIHPVYCQNVTVDNVSIIQPYDSPNTDGINPESSRDVRITNCFIDCGDDCVTIKSGYNEDGRRVNIPCENVVISNCTFAHGHSAVAIGSETSGGIKNILISNCVFNQTKRGLRIKSARGRGNVVKNVRATNIIMDHVRTAISFNMFYGKGGDVKDYQPVDENTPHFFNIHYSHISGTNIERAGIIRGLPEAPIEGLSLTDIDLKAETGMEIQFTKDLELNEVTIKVKNGSALTISDSETLELDEFTGRNSTCDTPVIRLINLNDCVIRNSKLIGDTGKFIEKTGDPCEIKVINSEMIGINHASDIDK